MNGSREPNGTVSRDFLYLFFFHQTPPPGPILRCTSAVSNFVRFFTKIFEFEIKDLRENRETAALFGGYRYRVLVPQKNIPIWGKPNLAIWGWNELFSFFSNVPTSFWIFRPLKLHVSKPPKEGSPGEQFFHHLTALTQALYPGTTPDHTSQGNSNSN